MRKIKDIPDYHKIFVEAVSDKEAEEIGEIINKNGGRSLYPEYLQKPEYNLFCLDLPSNSYSDKKYVVDNKENYKYQITSFGEFTALLEEVNNSYSIH